MFSALQGALRHRGHGEIHLVAAIGPRCRISADVNRSHVGVYFTNQSIHDLGWVVKRTNSPAVSQADVEAVSYAAKWRAELAAPTAN